MAMMRSAPRQNRIRAMEPPMFLKPLMLVLIGGWLIALSLAPMWLTYRALDFAVRWQVVPASSIALDRSAMAQ
jgi:hypothetical protein